MSKEKKEGSDEVSAINFKLNFTTGSIASAATCGSADEALTTAREALRQSMISKSKKGQLSEAQAAQILSALISYKLESAKLTTEERAAFQEEHEAACSYL